MNIKNFLLMVAVALLAAASMTASSQTVDFDDCQLSPHFQALPGNNTLFRDPDLTSENLCASMPGDYEHYLDASNPPTFYQSRANFDPGLDFSISFNYRPYLNNNSHFQMLINTNLENLGTVVDGIHMNNPQLGPLPTGALRVRLGDMSRVGFDGLAWEIVGSGNSGGAGLNYEALIDNTDPFQQSEVNLNISVTGGQFMTVRKQILAGSTTDPTPVTVLDNFDIGTGMSTTPGNFITFTTLEGAVQIDDFTFAAGPPLAVAKRFRVERVADGFDQPVYVRQAPGDRSSLYVVEERTDDFGVGTKGQIIKLDLASGSKSSYLVIDDVVPNIEGGLHSIAFHPDFQTNGKFYVTWLKLPELGQTQPHFRLDEYVDSGGSPTLNRTLIDIANLSPSPSHSIDWIGFKPGATGAEKGYLYVTTGDGGIQAEAPGFINVSQDLSTIRGKVLRIDVDAADAYPQDAERNYGIPAGNPFADDGDPNTLAEVFHSGLRNPWRASFDRQTGDLYVGDVGNGRSEEINFAKDGQAGLDFGWANREGTIANPVPAIAGPQGASLNPIADLLHSSGFIAVTGGYLYRGPITELQGLYFFGDSITEKLFTVQFDRDTDPATFNGANLTNMTERRSEFEAAIPGGGSLDLPVSFGEDLDGNLYIVDFGIGSVDVPVFDSGEIFRLALTDADFDDDNDIDGADFLDWQRGSGITGSATGADGDSNGDGDVDTDDLATWEDQFGSIFFASSSTASGRAVPEPSTLMLWVVAVAVASSRGVYQLIFTKA